MSGMDTPGRVRGSKVQSKPLRDRALRSAFMGTFLGGGGGQKDQRQIRRMLLVVHFAPPHHDRLTLGS